MVVSNFGRAMSLTGRVIKKLDPVPPLLEVDVTDDDHLAGLADQLGEHVDRLDGLVHSLAFANPETALGGKFLSTPWADVSTALQVSAYSLASLTMACKPLLGPTASVVGLTFDARVSWPVYDWMGVAKAALESTSRYLARYLGPEGVRVNLVAAGPLETLAKKAIGGAEEFNDVWATRAPIGWDPKDMTPTAQGRGRPAQRLLPQDHRRDDPRRRRPALHRGLARWSTIPPGRDRWSSFGCWTARTSTSRGRRPRSPSTAPS